MKKLLLFLFVSLCFISTKAQTAMTPASGSVDSSGSTVAGYCLLQGSLDGTNWVNVPTWKTVRYAATASFNLYDIDTFTLTNVTTAQTYTWKVTYKDIPVHPYLYYRVAVVMTTTKVTATGNYLYRKQY